MKSNKKLKNKQRRPTGKGWVTGPALEVVRALQGMQVGDEVIVRLGDYYLNRYTQPRKNRFGLRAGAIRVGTLGKPSTNEKYPFSVRVWGPTKLHQQYGLSTPEWLIGWRPKRANKPKTR